MHDSEVLNAKPRVDGIQRDETADENGSSHQQGHRHRNFCDDDGRAQLTQATPGDRVAAGCVKRPT